MCDMTRSHASHDVLTCVTWLVHLSSMTYSYAWHDSLICICHESFICVTLPLDMKWLRLVGSLELSVSFAEYSLFYRALLQKRRIMLRSLLIIATPYHSYTLGTVYAYAWHDSIICVARRFHTCDMTHSYVWHDSFICVTWLIHMCYMTHAPVRHDSFICEILPVHICGMSRSCMWHDSCICVIWLVHTWDMTRPHMWQDVPRTRHGILLVYCHERQSKLCHDYIHIYKYMYVCMYMCLVRMLCVPWLTHSATGLAHIILLFGQPPSVADFQRGHTLLSSTGGWQF